MATGMTRRWGGEAPNTNRGGNISSVYNAAATQQAQDYDDIMGGYSDLQSRAKSGTSVPTNFQPLSAISNQYLPNYSYNRSGDMSQLVSGLQDYSRTGGYSDADLGSIRERGLSPIRSVYANAKRNLDRQKSLQGGYSSNYGAVLSKMAREQSELSSAAASNVNAEIARMVASGKLSGLQSLSPIVTGENTQRNNISNQNIDAARALNESNVADQRGVRDTNASLKMRVDEMNRNNQLDDRNLELSALSGKSNLFGTTPALTQTFGNQVLQNNQQNLQAVQMANQIKNQRAGLGINLVGAAQAGQNKQRTTGQAWG